MCIWPVVLERNFQRRCMCFCTKLFLTSSRYSTYTICAFSSYFYEKVRVVFSDKDSENNDNQSDQKRAPQQNRIIVWDPSTLWASCWFRDCLEAQRYVAPRFKKITGNRDHTGDARALKEPDTLRYIYMKVCVNIDIYVYICMCAYIYICVYLYTHMSTHMYTHTHTHTHTEYICTHMYIVTS
jgi:hypothetical protein